MRSGICRAKEALAEADARIEQIENQEDYIMKYEYKIEVVSDKNNGSVDLSIMQNRINWYSQSGWRLVSAFSSEVGKNVNQGGYGGLAIGTNSTIDETILIFEKPIFDSELVIEKRIKNKRFNHNYPVYANSCSILRNNETEKAFLSIQGKVNAISRLEALLADVIVEDLFGIKYTVDDILFDSIVLSEQNEFKSERVAFEYKYTKAIYRVEIIIKKYVIDGKSYAVEYTEGFAQLLQNDQDVHKNVEDIIKSLDKCSNAKDVLIAIEELCDREPGLVKDDLIKKLNDTVLVERMYGNKKTRAVEEVKEFFEIM